VAKGKDTETVLCADQNLSAGMIVIAKSCKLQMQDVLEHPLGHLPTSLACNNGFIKVLYEGHQPEIPICIISRNEITMTKK